MKKLILKLMLLCMGGGLLADKANATTVDTIKLCVDSTTVYYQQTVKLNNNITTPQIFERILQFMAAKNYTQTYADDRAWKLIFTTSQDLNINRVYVGDDNDGVDPYTVQFAITLDLKNGFYRYTISNVLFFTPTTTYNKRQTLFDMYIKANNKDSKRVARNAYSLLASFERYLATFTDELRQGVEQKSAMYSSKF